MRFDIARSRLLALAVLAVLMLAAAVALAAGRVTIKNAQPEEVDGRWKLNLTIDYGSKPHVAYVPMIFSFEHVVQYELALTDQSGDKPVLVRRPLSNQQPINESMDVGFSDPTGTVFNVTKFDFVVRRDRGFEAGEYMLKIKRATDGVPVGTPLKVILKGDNPVVDRRAIVFTGDKKKDAKKEGEGSGDAKSGGAGDKKEGEAANDEPAPSEPAEPAAAAAEPSEPTEAPPPVPPKQGGCGCDVPGTSHAGGWAAIAMGSVGLALVRARRRRAL